MPGPKKIYQDKRLFEQVAREVHGDKYDYSKFALFNATNAIMNFGLNHGTIHMGAKSVWVMVVQYAQINSAAVP